MPGLLLLLLLPTAAYSFLSFFHPVCSCVHAHNVICFSASRCQSSPCHRTGEGFVSIQRSVSSPLALFEDGGQHFDVFSTTQPIAFFHTLTPSLTHSHAGMLLSLPHSLLHSIRSFTHALTRWNALQRYTQQVRELIQSMIQVNPEDRPTIAEVRLFLGGGYLPVCLGEHCEKAIVFIFLVFFLQVLERTEAALQSL